MLYSKSDFWGGKMKKYNKFIEKLFWTMIIVNPFLDALTGIYKTFFEKKGALISISPSLVVRLVFLSLLVIYLFTSKNKKAIFTLIPIGIAGVASVGVEILLKMEFSIIQDAMYIARFAYNIVMLFCWYSIFSILGYDKKTLIKKLNRLLAWTLIIIGLNVVIGQITGTGNFTYADRFGLRGSMGYYYAGNDITAVLMLLPPVVASGYIKMAMNKKREDRKEQYLLLIAASLSIVTNALIGTKTSFLSLFITAGVLILYSLFILIKEKNSAYLLRVLAIIVVAIVLSGIIIGSEALFKNIILKLGSLDPSKDPSFLSKIAESLSTTDRIAQKEGISTAILSGRQAKLKEAFVEFKNAGPLAWVFGIGRGSQEGIIEMDIPEVLVYYGLFGFVFMLWIYLAVGIKTIINLFKKFSFEMLMVATSLGLCVGYMVIAGHVLFSVTAGYYFTMMFAYAQILALDQDISDLDSKIPFPIKKV